MKATLSRTAVIRVLLALITFVSFANTIENPFHYDDGHSIVDNPHVRSLLNVPAFFSDASMFSGDSEIAMFRPLLLVSYALNYAVSQYDVRSYHLANLFLHLGCVFLLFEISFQLLRSRIWGGVAAGIFSLHPIQTEALNYISSRSEILAVFFVLFALWVHIAFATRRLSALVEFCCFTAGLLTKSVAIVLPALVIGFDLLIRRESSRIAWRLYTGYAVVIAAYLAMAGKFLHKATFVTPVRSFSEQIWSQVKALVWYAKLLVVPRGQSADHQFLISDSLLDPIAASAAGFLVSLALIATRRSVRDGKPLFVLGLAAVALAPSSLVPLNVLVNEHRLYLAHGAFSVAVAWALANTAVVVANRAVGSLLPALLAVVLMTTTVQRNRVWHDSESLWLDAAGKAPLMARPLIMIGDVFSRQGRTNEAIAAFSGALERDPEYAAGYGQLAQLLVGKGQLVEAAAVVQKGLAYPADAAARAEQWGALGEIFRRQAQSARGDSASELLMKSREAYSLAIELAPKSHAFHDNLGNVCQLLERPVEALGHHRIALVLASTVHTHVNIGNVFQMESQIDSALKYYRLAVQIDPSYAGAWASLGAALHVAGRKTEAQSAFHTAATLDPQFEYLVGERSGQR